MTFFCSIGASRIVLSLSDYFLSRLILFSMPFVALLILISKSYPKEDESFRLSKRKKYGFCVLTGVAGSIWSRNGYQKRSTLNPTDDVVHCIASDHKNACRYERRVLNLVSGGN